MHVVLVDVGGSKSVDDLVSYHQCSSMKDPNRSGLLHLELPYCLTELVTIFRCDTSFDPNNATVRLCFRCFDLFQPIKELPIDKLEVVAEDQGGIH